MKKTELEDVRNYWNQYTNDIEITEKPIGSKEFFEDLRDYRFKTKFSYMLDVVPFDKFKGKTVLEIGCGAGVDAAEWASHGAEITAVDLTPAGIALAKKHFNVRNLKGTLRVGNAEALEFKDNTFDVVYSYGVLHHTENTQKAIDEVFRVLKPGGTAIIMLYNKNSWMYFLTKFTGTNLEHADEDAPIIRYYTTKQLKVVFEKFNDVKISTHRHPNKTLKFKGPKGFLFNNVFVPVYNSLPERITKNLGFHHVILAKK